MEVLVLAGYFIVPLVIGILRKVSGLGYLLILAVTLLAPALLMIAVGASLGAISGDWIVVSILLPVISAFLAPLKKTNQEENSYNPWKT